MSTLSKLEDHRRSVVRRTALSAACYLGFLVTSISAAIGFRLLDDPVTLASVALVVGAFLLLPRDYVPPHLAFKAETAEERSAIEGLQRQQRIGLGIRIGYALGAVITILVIPRLLLASA